MSEIFISYRRDDSAGFAGRLEDDLSECFGEQPVFRDREIPAGTDFAQHLETTLGAAAVVLAVIGPKWLEVRGADGGRRLDDPDDWVRREIETGLARGVAMMPVLVGGAGMPPTSLLPPGLASLAGRQAFVLADRRWREELTELAGDLARISPVLCERRKAEAAEPDRIDAPEVLRDTLAQRETTQPKGFSPASGAGWFARCEGCWRWVSCLPSSSCWSGPMAIRAPIALSTMSSP